MGDRWLGEVLIMAVVAPLLAAPATLLLLALFRRSVVRGMRRAHSAAHAAAPGAAMPLTLPSAPAAFPPTRADVQRRGVSAAVVYSLGGLAFATVFVVSSLAVWGRATPLLAWFAFAISAVPLALALWIVLPAGRARTVAVAAWTVVAGGGLLVLVLKNLEIWRGILDIWWDTNAIATGLIIVFMHRRVRAAGPLVLLLSAAAVVGANLLMDALEFTDAVFAVGVWLTGVFGSVLGAYVLLALAGAAVGVVIAIPALALLGAAWRAKLFGDQGLSVDTVYLWYALAYAIWLAPEGAVWLWAGVVAFAAYRLVVTAAFVVLARFEPPVRRDLLLLRPFSLGVRSERLFDHLAKVWLRVGSVHMIAGPDLVRSTVSPPEFLAFLGRRLARRFAYDLSGLNEHLRTLDMRPDPDGRYRVNQLLCGDAVWREAMAALAALGTPVLMDLRGFSQRNQGCAYEVEHLVRNVPLGRVLFAVDSTTERPYLEWLEARIWADLPPGSPNAGAAGFGPRLVYVDDSRAGRDRLVRALLECTA